MREARPRYSIHKPSMIRPLATLRQEAKMTNAAHHHCTRAWYMRPPVWVLGVFLVALAVFGIVEMIGSPSATPYGIFLDQLEAGNIASLTFQGTQINGRFKHPFAEPSANGAASPDTFRTQVPEIGDPTLLPELRKQHVAIDVVSSSNWASWLARLPFPMLMIVAVLLIAGAVRLVRGGKASTGLGSAASMHPMAGMIGLVSGFSTKQSQGASTTPPASDKAKGPQDVT